MRKNQFVWIQKSLAFFAIVAFWAATAPSVTADVFKDELIGQVLPLEIHNQCNHPIKVVLMFPRYQSECVNWDANPSRCENSSHYCCDRWRTSAPGVWHRAVSVEDGWWDVEPGVRTGLTGSDGRVVLIKPDRYDRLYAYAESTDGSNLFWRGDPAGDGGLITNNLDDAMRLSNGEKIPYFEVGGGNNGKIDNVVRLTCVSEDIQNTDLNLNDEETPYTPNQNDEETLSEDQPAALNSSNSSGCFIQTLY